MKKSFDKEFLIISHRGASFYEPENTMRAFKKAVALGCGLIEFDVRKSLDDKLVVIHDKSVNRTTDGKGLVSSMTFDELQSLDAGKGEKIPLASDVLTAFKNKTKFVIEIKERGSERQIVNLIKDIGVEDDIFLVSFNKECLKKIRSLNGTVFLGLITVFGYKMIDAARQCGCNAVATHHHFATKNKVYLAHKSDMRYFCWTVNSKKKGEKLKAIGVDGIISDRPDIFY